MQNKHLKFYVSLLLIMVGIPAFASNPDSVLLIPTNTIDEKLLYKADSTTLQTQHQRCERIMYKISELHNWIVDLNFLSPGVERNIQTKVKEISEDLDDVEIQIGTVTSTDKVITQSVRDMKAYINDERNKLNKCTKLLKKKKRK